MIPTSTRTHVSLGTRPAKDAQATVVFLTEGSKPADGATAAAIAGEEASKAVARLLQAGAAKGKACEVVFDLIEEHHAIHRVYVLGLGKIAKINAETLRHCAAAIAKALKKHDIRRAAIILPTFAKIHAPEVTDSIVTGLVLAGFDFQECKGTAGNESDEKSGAKDKKNKGDHALDITLVVPPADLKAAEAAAHEAQVIAEAQNFCRTIANRPANVINPPSLAKLAQSMASEVGLKCTVLDEKQIAKLGMGGLLAVGAASILTPPRLIVLEHKPATAKSTGAKSAKPLLVVGKAITFDTGGISIKPADKMGKMIYDKCGGLAVLGLMYAAAKLKFPLHIVGILSSAENAISSRAYRPGDILTLYNGVTVEVTNTDAEGRLVLGDALAWGIEKFSPAAVVDLATLTGGVIVALGRNIAGLMSNNDGLAAELIFAGAAAGETLWRLPFGDDQREQIKSDLADIVNSAGREAHPLQGGAFLSYFIPSDGSVPWAHLDIAGVADTEKDLPLYVKGATGWGVRTLVNWVRARTKSQ